MKNLIILLLILSTVIISCQQSETTTSVVHDGIRWTSENETASYLASAGLLHFVNVEFDKAYTMSEHAVMVDSSLFASHTLLAILSRGEKREYHKSMAKKFVAGENETSRLYVSLLDVEKDSTGAKRRAIWADMRALSNGPFIHHMYARTRDATDDKLAVVNELNKVIAFCEENKMMDMAAASYNQRGYRQQLAGDLAGGTASIDRYVELYPDGHNSLDSRAEFYLLAGDTANAIVWYKKVRIKYPYSQSAQTQLALLEPRK